MPFIAECAFCHLTLQSIPDRRLGDSVQCPRCRNSFTLAAKTAPVATPTRGPRLSRNKPAKPSDPAIVEAPPLPPSTVEEPPLANAAPSESPLRWASLASFMMACAAFLLAAIFHLTLLTLLLGLAGFLIGTVCCLLSEGGPRRSPLAAAGSLVGLAAAICAVFVPSMLGLSPLGKAPSPPARNGPAVISLSGKGGLRPAAQDESSWADASQEALHYGDVRVRILSAVVGEVDFEPNRLQMPNSERGLTIRLRITNAGIARNIRYTSWGAARSPQSPLLHDNHGRKYAVKTFTSAWVVKGRAANSIVPSGKSLNDVIVFECPPSAIDYLRLELPASAAGAEGVLRMKIPRSMIVFH